MGHRIAPYMVWAMRKNPLPESAASPTNTWSGPLSALPLGYATMITLPLCGANVSDLSGIRAPEGLGPGPGDGEGPGPGPGDGEGPGPGSGDGEGPGPGSGDGEGPGPGSGDGAGSGAGCGLDCLLDGNTKQQTMKRIITTNTRFIRVGEGVTMIGL